MRVFVWWIGVATLGFASPAVARAQVVAAPFQVTYLKSDVVSDSSGTLAGAGVHKVRDGDDWLVWTMLVKDELGRHFLFLEPKGLMVGVKGKGQRFLEPGEKIAITFAPGNPLLVSAVEGIESAKAPLSVDPYSTRGRFVEKKNDFLMFERRNGLVAAAKLDKNASITVGRRSISVDDIQRGQEIVFTNDGSRTVAVTMLPDDRARLAALSANGFRATPALPPAGGLDLKLRARPSPVIVGPDLWAKMAQDLSKAPNLTSLTVGRPTFSTKAKIAAQDSIWTKNAETLAKLQSPFALDLNLNVVIDDTTALASFASVESLTLHAYGGDVWTTLKKMPNLKSLTIDVEADADLPKIVDHKALTGLFLAGNIARKSAVSDLGMKQLKKATKLTSLAILPDAKVTAVGLKELKDLAALRSLTLKATDLGAKEIRKNAGLKTLVLTDVSDAALKDLCEIKGLHELRLRTPCRVTDVGMKSLKNLKELRTLQIESSAVTAAGIRDLHALASLSTLEIQVKLSDDLLAELKPFPSLQRLRLANAGGVVTPAGIAHLAAMPKLEALDLSGTRITDASLAPLKEAKNLTWVLLPYHVATPTSPGLTFKAYDEFAKARPNLAAAMVTSGLGDYTSNATFRAVPSPFGSP